MASPLDDISVTLPCEDCGRETKKSIRWIKSHAEFRCACGTLIRLDAAKIKRELARVERSFAALESQLKKFNKR